MMMTSIIALILVIVIGSCFLVACFFFFGYVVSRHEFVNAVKKINSRIETLEKILLSDAAPKHKVGDHVYFYPAGKDKAAKKFAIVSDCQRAEIPLTITRNFYHINPLFTGLENDSMSFKSSYVSEKNIGKITKQVVKSLKKSINESGRRWS